LASIEKVIAFIGKVGNHIEKEKEIKKECRMQFT
jgi:hypothetical protein